MKYGKLENGYIRYAPKTVTWQGHAVNNPDAEKLKELGYLSIRYVDMPTDAPEGKHYESSWEQTETEIAQTWTLVEDEPVPEPPPTVEEQIAALQNALISQKIVGGGITNIPDSSENKIKDIKIFGNSEQITTTGAQLFDISKCPLEHDNMSFEILKTSNNVDIMNGYSFDENTQYTLKAEKVTSIDGNSAILRFEYTDNTRSDINVKDIADKVLMSRSGKTIKRLILVNPYLGQHTVYGLQVIKGTSVKPYEPYTGGKPSPSPEFPQEIRNVGRYNEETGKYDVDVIISDGAESGRKQTVTLSSDRPITRYDRLVKQDGVYGWLYGAKEIMLSSFTDWALPDDKRPDDRTRRIFIAFPDAVPNQHCFSKEYKSVEPNVTQIKTLDYECIAVANGNYLTLKVDKNIGTTPKEYIEYFKQNDSKVLYHSISKDFVQLTDEEQKALKKLSTYYPTTVITVDGGVEVTYTADTKNYIDNKIKQEKATPTAIPEIS